jgi:hypothetical protein
MERERIHIAYCTLYKARYILSYLEGFFKVFFRLLGLSYVRGPLALLLIVLYYT